MKVHYRNLDLSGLCGKEPNMDWSWYYIYEYFTTDIKRVTCLTCLKVHAAWQRREEGNSGR